MFAALPSATAVFVKITDGINAQEKSTLGVLVFLAATSLSSAPEALYSAGRTQLDVNVSGCVVGRVRTQCQHCVSSLFLE